MYRSSIGILLFSTFIGSQTSACSVKTLAVGTTSKILLDAQPALKQEPDYDLAAQAIPASLKTVEGFHFADPSNERITRILAEGYCQYAVGFIEDLFERAHINDDLDEADYLAQRATKSYLRCVGYSLELLGDDWQEKFLEPMASVAPLIEAAGSDKRDAMLFLAVGLGGAINLNKDDIAMLEHIPKVKKLLKRVIAIDKDSPPSDPFLAALPHIGLGRIHTSTPPALGGKPELGKKHFEKAFAMTNKRLLLAQVYLARSYAVATQKQSLFRKLLVRVLKTDPAIWPEQRLANEIAHRRARLYLKHEKDWF